jgi:hypothetical protein
MLPNNLIYNSEPDTATSVNNLPPLLIVMLLALGTFVK